MAFPVPTFIVGELFNATKANSYWRDNLTDLRAGALALSGQAANDFIYCSGAAQLGRVAAVEGKVPRFNGTTWEMVHPLELAWPIGSIYRANVATNPGTLLGIGTWTAFAAGRVTVGFDSGDADFNLSEKTGGSKAVTLMATEIPAHSHTQDAHNHTQDSHNHTQDAHSHTQDAHSHTQDAHNHTQNAHQHSVSNVAFSDFNDAGVADVYDDSGTKATNSTTATNAAQTASNNAATATNQATTATNQNTTATNQNTTATNQSTGGGGSHNNLMPYVVCYCWKRTA